jgi:hypothetical protein
MAFENRRRNDGDDRVEFFLPAEEIDFEVLASDIRCYLGPEASVSVGVHHRDGRAGYYIKSYVAVTTAMIADLKADSQRWRDEQRNSRPATTYDSSSTHRKRLHNGPTHRAPTADRRQASGRERLDNTSANPTRSQPTTISANRSQRQEESYRSQGTISSPLSSSQSRQGDPPPRSSSLVAAEYTPQQDSMMADRYQPLDASRGNQNISNPPRGPDPDRHRPEEASRNDQGRVQLDYRQTQTEEGRVQYSVAYNAPNTGKQYMGQQSFSQEERNEMKQTIVQALRDKGHTQVTQKQLDSAVEQALQRQASSQRKAGGEGQPDTTESIGFNSTYATSGATDTSRYRRRD